MPDLIATAAFGLEAVVDRELERLGYADRVVEDGKVTFAGDESAIARCNLWLRSADRVLLQIDEFAATDFGELFDRVEALPWEEWLPRDAAIPVEVRAVRSAIRSPRSGQAIVKKAIVTRLGRVYGLNQLPETGPRFPIDVAIVADNVTIAIDTSGDGLHKRGYRKTAGVAPLKETLAAGMLQLSYWKRDRTFADPFCGSGTLPIEAAMLGRNRAPGLDRRFLAEEWPALPRRVWDEARSEAKNAIITDVIAPIVASDIDQKAIATARRNAETAGVARDIEFSTKPISQFRSSDEYGCLVCNPPYGERLGERGEAEELYRELGSAFARSPTWSFYVLTSHPAFQDLVGRRPDRRRKLYNGRIECVYYQFYGPRPPKCPPATLPQGSGVDARPARADHDRVAE
ncbi:MAG: class I SAM-dependent RNA methyltransferase [Planctomycetota bacterium]|nr:class I SAM-dependent RNA methyltransferase [Planctomycetaceae bacterium]MDQ3331930.1 class I SAM-dependent RNA methyltransferase [Planctomycetota bacterium]